MRILFIVYDNESYIANLPIGIAQLTAALEKHGYTDIHIYHQDIHHYPESHLQQLLEREHFDFIGLSFIGGYWQYKKATAIAKAVRQSGNKGFFCLGGHGPSPEPEFFMKKLEADAVCIGEGDETIVDLLDALEHKRPLSTVKGIAYMEDGKCTINERRPLIRDIDALPFPAYHKLPMMYYRLIRMPHSTNKDFVACILSGRGCLFKCNFCYRMDTGFRPRSNEAIIEEIKLLQKDYGINYIAFFDELLMSSEKRAISLCEEILKNNLQIKWECNGRLNFAKPDVLKVMKRSGCVFINYGIECFDDEILRIMHKNLTTHQITRGIEATLQEGISPGFNIIFGNINENRETLMKGVNFLLKYDDGAQCRTIRPVTPYPGSELYYIAIEKGLLKDCEDFYENKHLNSDLLAVNFTSLTDDEFYEALYDANKILLDNYNKRIVSNTETLLDNLYHKHDASFRGFRHG